MPTLTMSIISQSQAVIELLWQDWVVVGIYAVVMFGIAIWAMGRIKDSGGFLLGKRKIGLWMLIASGFAGGTSANHPMGVATATFKGGMSGMWLSLTWILLTPFFWIYPPVARRLRVVTVVDMFNLRFGRLMGVLFKTIIILTGPISMGLGLKSAAIVIEVMTGGGISETAAIYVIAIPTLIYTLMGGIVAAYATDIFQGVLIVILSFLMIPFAINKAGGIAALDAGISDRFTELISTEGGQGFGIWWVIWFLIASLMSAPLVSMGGSLTARNEMYARLSVIGSLIKRFCTVGWGLTGLFAIALYGGNEMLSVSPDKVFPYAAGDLLPVVLKGLMVASVLGAVMSSLDGILIGLSGILTKNFYKEYLVKNASAQHYLIVTQIFAMLVMVLACIGASANRNLIDYITLVEPLGSLCGVAVFFSIFWRRLTKWGAVSSVLTMFPLFYIVQKIELVDGLASLPWGIGYAAELMQKGYSAIGYELAISSGEGVFLPIEISYPLYLIPGILVMIVVSYLTKQHNQRAVAEYYARLDTPLGLEYKLRDRGFHEDDLEELDDEVVYVDESDRQTSGRLILVDLLRIPKLIGSGQAKLSDYQIDMIGLIASIAFIILFIVGVQCLGKLF
ncbi:MAG: sodium:solute symporter family protein [Okeania sp. SIO2C2]|uniref:sodium:solute symporter family protein n=1 Tax=Okeania sp. SIO2C2 TaxID=2607787 RepID=UPI0013B6013F|nr:sodium:solute symporter family protein [Okeania sp. SIO2C2]NEP85968.1 sodium:solute symporter family protein [Okeania sp. SIO2C2]